MKTLPWKKVAIAVVAIVLAIAGVFYINSSTGSSPVQSLVNPAFGEHISSFTAGVVSSGSTIRIVLTNDVVDSTEVGNETSVSLFDFSPGVSGKTFWVDKRTVEYKPNERLISGQVYTVKFQLSKLIDNLPPDLKRFEYTFQVMPQNFEVSVENIKPYINTDLKKQKIEGILYTADYASNDAVEKVVSAKQNGNTLSLTWSHIGDGKQHSFVVENVVRGDEGSTVNLNLSGKSIGVDRSVDQAVEIPSLSDFKIMNTKVVHNPNQYVVLQFSDPLKEKQSLEGLISISDLTDLDFEVHDNEIWVYPPVRQTGTKTITVEPGIRNILDYKMKSGSSIDVEFEQLNPAVRFTGEGNIIPASDGLILPFEAVNLKSVDVQIVKIFENNVLQFFQNNSYDGRNELRRVGKPVLKKNISLEASGVSDLGKWNRFTLDLSTLISTEPGAIYQVSISFKKKDVTWLCEGGEETDNGNLLGEDWNSPETESEYSYWDSYEDYYYGEDYDWEQRDNPCNSSYYSGNKNIKKNILASDLGLIAKTGGDGNTMVFVNDLKTTKPLSGITVELYDFQQQLLGSVATDVDGKAIINTKDKPFIAIAKNGAQRGYLKLHDGESVSLSSFDVGGETIQKGLKGFLYGERGVWRPGDSLFLTFILEDKLKLLPAGHPVVFELSNPQGQTTARIVKSNSENGFYNFATKTDDSAPTGNWNATVKVGGTSFSQQIKIETVKPNRLRINLDFGKDRITSEDNNISGNLQVNWLHGAPGRKLKAEFEVLLTKGETKFQKYPDFTFEDPSRDFSSEAQTIFDDYTDDEGKAVVRTTLNVGQPSPGVLNAIFRGKVFEDGGNFSIDRFSIPFYPYSSFTGIRLPQGDAARGMLLTDTTHVVDVVTIDANGNPVNRNNVQMAIYKLEWRWWWDNSEESAVYMNGSYAKLLHEGKVNTINGKGKWKFKIKYPEWGRYMVKAYDPVSGHSTAKIVYIDWPGWAGRSRGDNQGATMLSFNSDKGVYNIGEKVSIIIPGSGEGRALVSIENGSRVIQSYWVETQKGDTPFSFEVTREMTPNVFAHVTLLQPHSQNSNDLPMRLYGVIPIQVEDPHTRLEPVISMPDVLEPGKEVKINVSEKSNRKMTYTVAMVDEGLLDLTRFKTPDPWKRFYAREALGVKTWDLYDHVMGGFGSQIERLLAIGGDMEGGKQDDAKANRFKPVVKFLGPFTLDGGSDTHTFIMPQYVGSVKTMIVAGYEGAYGKTDKATPVRKPLMVLATLPRVLGPEEKLKLPVTLFAMEKNIKNVKVTVRTSGPLYVSNETQQVVMNNADMTVDFDLEVKSMLGIGKIEVVATSGNYKATDVIEIDVRNPNPMVTRVQEGVVQPGSTWMSDLQPVGVAGTNTAVLEVSILPPVNLDQRLQYLIMYPHGCIEQTTSSVFPQLYVDMIKEMNDEEKTTIQKNVKAGIERLKLFVTNEGGFAYWPGETTPSQWGSSFAGHFLVEAEAKGYYVSSEILKRWKKYQRKQAQAWRKNMQHSEFAHENNSNDLIQAYRLYTLAIAGDAEIAAMNRLREQSNLSLTAAWMLAASYAKVGQPEAAKKIMSGLSTSVKPYQELDFSFGSDVRDRAIILETLILLGERVKGATLYKEIADVLGNPNAWMSTQSTSWSLKSISQFAATENKGDLKFTYSYNGKELTASTGLAVAQVKLPMKGITPGSLKLSSNTQATLYTRVISQGIPARGTEQDENSNLNLTVNYTDVDGHSIDPGSLEQGAEFIAAVTIQNPGIRGDLKNMALTQIFPSGWEINNLRLDDAQERLHGDKPTYQDIRDDRVYTYFDIGAGQQKTFKVLLTASYAGNYYLPAVSCEAMYDRTIYARKRGQETAVTKHEVQ